MTARKDFRNGLGSWISCTLLKREQENGKDGRVASTAQGLVLLS